MSMHQQDYFNLAGGLFGWFAQATAAGTTPQVALVEVMATALAAAAQKMAPVALPPAAAPTTTQTTG